MKKIWCPRIRNAKKLIIDHQISSQSTPKVCVLHVGTNDLSEKNEQDLANEICNTYEAIKAIGSKFVFSTIAPRFDAPPLNAKAVLVNAIVVSRLEGLADVAIARNDNLYTNGVINKDYYDEDGTHVNDDGASIIANNTRHAVCRALDMELLSTKKSDRINNRDRGRGRGGRGTRGNRFDRGHYR